MKRHEQLIIQDRRNKRKIKNALRDAVRKLTDDQLTVFIKYMMTHKNRMGYITCTPAKMERQLTHINNASITTFNIHFSFRGSYGDSLGMDLPARFIDNAEGRQAAVDQLIREMNEYAELRREGDIQELRSLAKRFPEIAREVSEKQLT